MSEMEKKKNKAAGGRKRKKKIPLIVAAALVVVFGGYSVVNSVIAKNTPTQDVYKRQDLKRVIGIVTGPFLA